MVHPFVVTAVLLVLTAALTSVRPARSGTWLVVLRFGRVNRIATSGVVVRIPGIDRCLVVPRVPERLPFTVSAPPPGWRVR